MHIHITKVGPYWATRALSPLQCGAELESNINTSLSRVPELPHKSLQNQNEKKIKITASTLFLFKKVFSSKFFQGFIAIISLYYKIYNNLLTARVSFMLKWNCFNEIKLYLPVIALFFFIVFCTLTYFFYHKKPTRF